MIFNRLSRAAMSIAAVFFFATFMEFLTPDAEARAGRGRSSGSSSFGSKKQSQNQQPANNNFNQAAPGANPARGSMMRNIAGGMAGGFLGSMLFSSMSSAAGSDGAAGAAGAGGIGMLEILLIAGLAFFGFRWWKSRQQTRAYAPTNAYRMASGNNQQQYGSSGSTLDDRGSIDSKRFLAFAGEAIEQDHASDIFFKIQGAWTRRDLTSANDLVTEEMKLIFETDMAELRQKHEINRLENIAVRRAEVTDNWSEDGKSFAKVRFTANLLDYNVNEANGAVIAGSATDPVKFEEDWIFVQSTGSKNWRLAGIEQI